MTVTLYACGIYDLAVLSGDNLLARNHHQHQQVDQNTRHAARNKGNKHSEPEPECADTEELSESTANACNHTIAP